MIKEYPHYCFSVGRAQEYIAGVYVANLKDYQQAMIEYQKVIDNYPDYYNIGGITWRIERCRLLIEFQKRGVDITEYESEDPERLSLLLKLYDKGVKEKDIRRLRSGAPLTELKRLLDQEEIFEFKDEPFTPSTEPLIEEEDG